LRNLLRLLHYQDSTAAGSGADVSPEEQP